MDRPNPLEELARIDEKIRLCEQRLEEQRERLASMDAGGRNREDSEHLHANLVASLHALEGLRDVIRKEVRDAGL
ncbi:hypothetical protein PPMP20_30270 [Paraburkholderia phymatum]|uniref:hypothetical protein n=1 Tax=Paraburkholderia phymatum TaxID=148447 RepID=UPI0012FE79D6|nr:hypothetical protein [Paraburkholderia phymatum]